MPLTPLPAAQALDQYYLEARCKILDLAAILDRMGRGKDPARAAQDPRVARIMQALDVLRDQEDDRAQRIQQVFSLPYDPAWKKPQPR